MELYSSPDANQQNSQFRSTMRTGGEVHKQGGSTAVLPDPYGYAPNTVSYEMGQHSLTLPKPGGLQQLHAGDLRDAAINSAAAQGIAQGLGGIGAEFDALVHSAGGYFGRTTVGRWIGNLFRTAKSGIAQVRGFSMKGMQLSLTYATNKGVWDGINSTHVQMLSGDTRMYGGLEIPFVATDDAFYEDYRLRQMEMLEYKAEVGKLMARTIGAMTAGNQDQSWLGSMFQKILLTAGIGTAAHYTSKAGQETPDMEKAVLPPRPE